MIFEQMLTKADRQALNDGVQMFYYIAKQRDKDIKKLVKYQSAQTEKKLKKFGELGAPISRFCCSNMIHSIPDDAKTNASFSDLSGAIEELQEAYRHSPETKNSFRHFVISLALKETLTTRQWKKVVKKVMKRLGYENAAWVSFIHDDTDSQHCHIATSTCDQLYGKIITNYMSHAAAEEVMREMEIEFGLQQVDSWKTKDYGEGEINNAKLNNVKQMIRRKIDEIVKRNNEPLTLNQFEYQLLQQGVRIILRTDSNNELYTGITFCFGDKYKISGGSLGGNKKYNLGNLVDRGVLVSDAKVIAKHEALSPDQELQANVHYAKDLSFIDRVHSKYEREAKAAALTYAELRAFNKKRYEIMKLHFFISNMGKIEELAEELRAKRKARRNKNLLEVKFYIEAENVMKKDMKDLGKILAQIIVLILAESFNKRAINNNKIITHLNDEQFGIEYAEDFKDILDNAEENKPK